MSYNTGTLILSILPLAPSLQLPLPTHQSHWPSCRESSAMIYSDLYFYLSVDMITINALKRERQSVLWFIFMMHITANINFITLNYCRYFDHKDALAMENLAGARDRGCVLCCPQSNNAINILASGLCSHHKRCSNSITKSTFSERCWRAFDGVLCAWPWLGITQMWWIPQDHWETLQHHKSRSQPSSRFCSLSSSG